MSTPTTTALQGTSSGSNSSKNLHNITTNINNLPLDDFQLSSSQLLSLLDSKDEAFQVLKSDLMDALNKEVKSLDEDSWMFEGPRSRINLIAKPGSFSFHLSFQRCIAC
ncbi:Protein SAMBA [Bienertia sinuspersici]